MAYLSDDGLRNRLLAVSLWSALTCALVGLAGCGKAPRPSEPSDPRACAGENCLRWFGVRADHCEQFDPTKPNRSYTISQNLFPAELPITVFYSVIRRDSAGVEKPQPDVIKYVLPNGQRDQKICHAVRLDSEIYTQLIEPKCATSRTLPNNATHNDCEESEKYTKRIEIDANFSPSLKASFNRGDVRIAPNSFAHDENVDCTKACDGSDGNECIAINSLDLSAALSNLISSWKPGEPLTKHQLMLVVGDEKDVCERSEGVVGTTGRVSNKASKECAVPFDLGGLKAELILGVQLTGEMHTNTVGRFVTFDESAEMRLSLPDEASVFDGPVSEIVAPDGKKFIDFRTPSMCFRVTPR